MGDPVERMRRFVEARQQQVRFERAKAVWSQRAVELVPRVEAVVAVVREALAPEQFQGPVVSVLADGQRDLFPLVVAFGPRSRGSEGTLKLRPGPLETEAGASAVFRCEADGNLYGFRYPFHAQMKSVPPEQYIELGDPARIQAEDLGNAVAEFLEWATVGDGSGGRKLRFGMPATLAFVAPPVKLSAIAA